MDIRKVKKLIELLEESNISEIEIQEGEESVRISRHPNGVSWQAPMPQGYAAPQQPGPGLQGLRGSGLQREEGRHRVHRRGDEDDEPDRGRPRRRDRGLPGRGRRAGGVRPADARDRLSAPRPFIHLTLADSSCWTRYSSPTAARSLCASFAPARSWASRRWRSTPRPTAS